MFVITLVAANGRSDVNILQPTYDFYPSASLIHIGYCRIPGYNILIVVYVSHIRVRLLAYQGVYTTRVHCRQRSINIVLFLDGRI